MTLLNELFSLKNKKAIVTGASSGLGRRFAYVLAMAGAEVVCMARREEKLDTLVNEIHADGGKAHKVIVDLSDREQVPQAWQQAEDILGSIDILVNNAGVGGREPFLEDSMADYDLMMRVNVDAVWILTRLFAKNNIDNNIKGNIIITSSVAGIKGSVGNVCYGITKAAVINMTRSLVKELSPHGIRINTIAPGLFDTDMPGATINKIGRDKITKSIPIGHIAETKELDGALLYLASNRASSYTTGSTVVVDGGYLCLDSMFKV